MDRVIFLERLQYLVELSSAGLLATARTLPKHWDKAGITVRTVASKFTPDHRSRMSALVGDPTKGLPIGNGLRALREPWEKGMLRSKRRLQIVTPDGTTVTTIIRPKAKSQVVATMVNTSRKDSIPTERLAKSYESFGFRPDRTELNKAIDIPAQANLRTMYPEIADRAGGIPMIRRPSKKKP